MILELLFEPLSTEHTRPVMDVFNHYAENSFAAYPESKLPDEFFSRFLEMAKGYPAYAIKGADDGEFLGFCLLRAFNQFPTFRHTAEVSYFLAPEAIGQGIGQSALAKLENDGKTMGIRVLLANISSLNEISIEFHRRNGFVECGRLRNVGRKMGMDFDVVWMEKELG